MKKVIISLIIILFFFVNSYAQENTWYLSDPPLFDNVVFNNEIAFSTNESSYVPSDIATLLGVVNDAGNGKKVIVTILNSENQIIRELELIPTQKGIFQVVVIIPDVISGIYNIEAKHGVDGEIVLLPITLGNIFENVTVVIPEKADVQFGKQNFTPDIVFVEAGELITWVNSDNTIHTVVSGIVTNLGTIPDGIFDSGTFGPKKTFSVTLPEGEYTYFCELHPWLTGKIKVTPYTGPPIVPEKEELTDFITINNAEDSSEWNVITCSRCTTNLELSNDRKEGNNSIHFTLQAPNNVIGDGVTINLDFEPIDLNEISDLILWIKTKGNSEHAWDIMLKDSSSNLLLLDNFNSFSYPNWQELTLSTSEYFRIDENFNPNSVVGLSITSPEAKLLKEKQAEIFLDNIRIRLQEIDDSKKQNHYLILKTESYDLENVRTIKNDDFLPWLWVWKETPSDNINLDDISYAKSGINALSVDVDASGGVITIRHDFASDLQDWSAYDSLEFWFKGENTKKPLHLILRSENRDKLGVYDFVDDSIEWKKITVPLYSTFESLNQIREIEILFEKGTIGQFYIDDIKLDKNLENNFMQINNDLYANGGNILISGKVSHKESKSPVTIRFSSPNNNIISINQLLLSRDNSFAYIMPITGPQFNHEGIYTIYAQYGIEKLNTENFIYIGSPILIENFYKGYDIYSLEKTFYAFSSKEGTFNVNRINSNDYNSLLIGNSIDELKETIEKNPLTGPYLIQYNYKAFEIYWYKNEFYAIPINEKNFLLSDIIKKNYSQIFVSDSIEKIKKDIDGYFPKVIIPDLIDSTPESVTITIYPIQKEFPVENQVLMEIWNEREVLQKMFPEVEDGDFIKLQEWATVVGWEEDPRLVQLIPEGKTPKYSIEGSSGSNIDESILPIKILVLIVTLGIGGTLAYKFYKGSNQKLPENLSYRYFKGSISHTNISDMKNRISTKLHSASDSDFTMRRKLFFSIGILIVVVIIIILV